MTEILGFQDRLHICVQMRAQFSDEKNEIICCNASSPSGCVGILFYGLACEREVTVPSIA
jgi:hypothetical protein